MKKFDFTILAFGHIYISKRAKWVCLARTQLADEHIRVRPNDLGLIRAFIFVSPALQNFGLAQLSPSGSTHISISSTNHRKSAKTKEIVKKKIEKKKIEYEK